MNNIKISAFVVLFLMSLVSSISYLPQQRQTEFEYSFTSNNASWCEFTTANTPYGVVEIYQLSDKNGNTFNNTINKNNFSKDGDYCFNIICSDGIQTETGSVCRTVNSSGTEVGLSNVVFYIFLISLTLLLIYYSFKITINNPIDADDKILYSLKSEHNFKYYFKVLQSKLFILGSFGIYIGILLFLTFLNLVLSDLGYLELFELTKDLTIILGWGLIPFVMFWIIYIIILFYRTTERIFKYQFGGFRNERS